MRFTLDGFLLPQTVVRTRCRRIAGAAPLRLELADVHQDVTVIAPDSRRRARCAGPDAVVSVTRRDGRGNAPNSQIDDMCCRSCRMWCRSGRSHRDCRSAGDGGGLGERTRRLRPILGGSLMCAARGRRDNERLAGGAPASTAMPLAASRPSAPGSGADSFRLHADSFLPSPAVRRRSERRRVLGSERRSRGPLIRGRVALQQASATASIGTRSPHWLVPTATSSTLLSWTQVDDARE